MKKKKNLNQPSKLNPRLKESTAKEIKRLNNVMRNREKKAREKYGMSGAYGASSYEIKPVESFKSEKAARNYLSSLNTDVKKGVGLFTDTGGGNYIPRTVYNKRKDIRKYARIAAATNKKYFSSVELVKAIGIKKGFSPTLIMPSTNIDFKGLKDAGKAANILERGGINAVKKRDNQYKKSFQKRIQNLKNEAMTQDQIDALDAIEKRLNRLSRNTFAAGYYAGIIGDIKETYLMNLDEFIKKFDDQVKVLGQIKRELKDDFKLVYPDKEEIKQEKKALSKAKKGL